MSPLDRPIRDVLRERTRDLLKDPAPNPLDTILSLAEAAKLLGVAPDTLRQQAQAGRLMARLIGKTWITTRDEVERYRREHLGRVGRPRG